MKSPTPPDAEGKSSSATYCSFSKYIKGSGRAKTEALFVPMGTIVPNAKLLELITKTWKMPMPNLLIQIDAGMAHPSTLATEELCMLRQFDEWVNAARRHVQRNVDTAARRAARPSAAAPVPSRDLTLPPSPSEEGAAGAIPAGASAPPSPPPSPPPTGSTSSGGRARVHPEPPPASDALLPPPDPETLKVVRQLLQQKLRTVFSAVVEAAAMTNNWLVVDRTTSKSPTAEYLLELALDQSAQRPYVIVIDSEERLHNFTSTKAEKQLAQINSLKSRSASLGSDQNSAMSTIEWLYEPKEFLEAESFDELELPRQAEPAHIDKATGNIYSEMRWWYFYLQTLWASGTHYIVLESGDDFFDISPIGPLGCICAHGGALMMDRLESRLNAGLPLVMLHNSGGITQAFASLLRAIVAHPDAQAEELLQYLELPSQKEWASRIGLPQIMMMKELNARAPTLFHKTIVTVDLLRDSAEDMLATLSAAFEGQGGVPELGLGNAEALVVSSAWRRHMVLFRNAKRFRRRADVLQFFYLLLSALATVLAVVYSDLLIREGGDNAELGSGFELIITATGKTMTHTLLEYSIIIVPIFIALLVSTRSRMRPREKWSACYTAAHQIVTEIYCYRMRALDYEAGVSADKGDDAEDGSMGVSSTAQAKMMRELFVSRVSELFSGAVDQEVSKGDSLWHTGILSSASTSTVDDFRKDLRKHYEKHLYGKQRSFMTIIDDVMDGDNGDAKPPAFESDDLLTPLNTQTYMVDRARKLSIYLEKRAPVLEKQLSFLELFAQISTSASAVLALVGLAQWVAIPISIATLTHSIIEYFSLSEQVSVNNSALRDVQNLLTWWDSLSMLDRRSRHARARAAAVLEGAILASVSANASSSQPTAKGGKKGSDGGDGDEEEGGSPSSS